MYKVSFKRWPEFFMNALQKEYNLRYCPFCMIIVLVFKMSNFSIYASIFVKSKLFGKVFAKLYFKAIFMAV